MPEERQNPENRKLIQNQQQSATLISAVFDDPESRHNIVGLYNLLLKLERRNYSKKSKVGLKQKQSPA